MRRQPYPKPEPYQVWESCDKRDGRRQVIIRSLFKQHRYGVLEDVACVENTGTGRQTTIMVRRLRPGTNGWRLVGYNAVRQHMEGLK